MNARQALNAALRPFDIALVRRSTFDAARQKQGPSFVAGNLPNGAAAYLTRDNPRLLELQALYRGHPATSQSLWTAEYVTTMLDLSYFRGDNVYVWQVRNSESELQYLLSAYYTRSVDDLGLLNRLQEDGSFGAYTFEFNGDLLISRDLLDSVLEINFLERHLGLSHVADAQVLDIGAGYGRLAHRIASCLPNVGTIYCADAVPESTFVCEYYLQFRRVDQRARTIALPDIDKVLRGVRVKVATNIHSFSECPLSAIEWWLGLIARHDVEYLMIAPNTPSELLSTEADGSRIDFLPTVLAHGFELAVKEHMYHGAPSVQEHGVHPSTYFLFRKIAS